MYAIVGCRTGQVISRHDTKKDARATLRVMARFGRDVITGDELIVYDGTLPIAYYQIEKLKAAH